MKLRFLLSVAALAATFSASAQWVSDSVTMGAGYANDVFYSMKNAEQKNIANNTWHLAFQMTPPGPYGNVSVLANHVQSKVQVYPLHLAASAKFTTLAAADTVGLTSTQVYNADSSWNYGAFNRSVSSNPFSYSWGLYDINTHNVNGDSIYLLKVGTTNPVNYKLWIKQFVSYPFDSVKWIFRIAQFDGTGDTTVVMKQSNYTNRLFGYFNVTTNTELDREPNRYSWDILFTRYVSLQTQASVTIPYNVTGVLSNFGVSVADVRGVNPDTAQRQNYAMTKNLSEIGSDWKTFNMTTNTYDIDTTATFFIKTGNTNEYWQIQFTRFDFMNGKSVFRKRLLSTTSVNSVNNSISSYYAAPNPANNMVTLMIDTKESTAAAQLTLSDISGKVVMQQTTSLSKGVNAFNIPTASIPGGMYMLSVNGSNIKLAQKLVIAH